MVTIPIQAVGNQTLNVTLNNQNVQIGLYQKRLGLFVDTYVNGTAISLGVLAHDWNPLVKCTYNGFSGQLLFVDTQGTDDPTYDGLGARYVLVYLTDDEVSAL